MKRTFKLILIVMTFVLALSGCAKVEEKNYHTMYIDATDMGYKGTFEEFYSIIKNETVFSQYQIAVKNGFTGTETEWLISLSGKSAYEIAVEKGFIGTETEWLNGLKAKSAYEIAVEKGFVGTETEWLNSLKAKSAYEVAVDNGFTGTETEWLNSLKAKSAYEVAVENGFMGTETEWLASLRGKSAYELSGFDGSEAEWFASMNGKSAYELAVLNGFMGTETEWLESLKARSVYEIAVDNGFEGTESEWLDFQKPKSAYEIAVDNGFEGSEEEWLKSLYPPDLTALAEKVMPSLMEIVTEGSKSTGIVLNNDGYVITNAHCITYKNDSQETVEYTNIKGYFDNDSEGHVMEIISYDSVKDIAILKFKNVPELKPVTVCSSSGVKTGDYAFAVGNALGIGLSVTAGNISHSAMDYGNHVVLMTDAAVNSGNSGGALFNAKGELIGIVTFKLLLEENVFAEGMGLALTSDFVFEYIDSLEPEIAYIRVNA